MLLHKKNKNELAIVRMPRKFGKSLLSHIYEGTNDIKETRKDTPIQEYENFKLTEGETTIDIETKFTRIVNELEQLGKSYTTNEKNRRILKALPSN